MVHCATNSTNICRNPRSRWELNMDNLQTTTLQILSTFLYRGNQIDPNLCRFLCCLHHFCCNFRQPFRHFVHPSPGHHLWRGSLDNARLDAGHGLQFPRDFDRRDLEVHRQKHCASAGRSRMKVGAPTKGICSLRDIESG